MNLSNERQAFLDRQAKRFDEAETYLRYAINIDAETKVLARKFFEARSGTLYELFGGPTSLYAKEDPTVTPYNAVFEPIQFMEELAHFISHEIHDDGSPAIVYYREDPEFRTFEPKTRTFKKEVLPLGHTLRGERLSYPYLHRSTDYLSEKGIPFEIANVKNLIALLDEMEDDARRIDNSWAKFRVAQGKSVDKPEIPPYQHLIPDFFED